MTFDDVSNSDGDPWIGTQFFERDVETGVLDGIPNIVDDKRPETHRQHLYFTPSSASVDWSA